MHRQQIVIAAASIALASAVFAQAPDGPLPERAEDVRPLLIGSQVPAVEVRTLDDETVDLQKVVLGERTILLFYRGGW